MWKEIAFIIGCIVFLYKLADSAQCNNNNDEASCESTSGCLWDSSGGYCTCASNVTMDIIFALDSSGSIGSSDFEVEKDWVIEVIESGLTNDARVAINRFASSVVMLLTFEEQQRDYSDEDDLKNFVDSITYTGGATDTTGSLDQCIALFNSQSSNQVSQVLVMITDGNPNAPDGDNNVCARAPTLKSMGVTVVIIGVGSSWNPAYMDCLVTDDSHIIQVDDYTDDALDQILPALTDITCPVTYELIISEVQLETVSDTEGSRFIELYNPGTSIPLTDVDLEGIFEGTITADDSISLGQGQYLVIYDDDVVDEPSCEDCYCAKGSQSNANWCDDAVYLKCCANGCSCWFAGSGMTNEDWYVNLVDTTDNDGSNSIDYVTYDSSTWPTIFQGYTYELKYIGYDNDIGANWDGSCNTRGTPGYEPIKNCTWTCTDDQCQLNGASTADCKNDNTCDCDDSSYYFSGRTCSKVPPPGDCYAYWLKNDTNGQRWVRFEWEKAQTDDEVNYTLNYYTDQGNNDRVYTSSRIKEVSDYDYSRGASAEAGRVRTVIDGSTSDYVQCWPVTLSPSSAPTDSPTMSPTPAPSSAPTKAPTFDSPRCWIGGDICLEDRCGCNDASWECTDNGTEIFKNFAAADGEDQYVTVKLFPSDFPYLVRVFWNIEYFGNWRANETVDDEDEDDQGEDDDEQRRRRRLISGLPEDAEIIHQGRSILQFTTTDFDFGDTTEMATTEGIPSEIGISPSAGEIQFDGSSEERAAFEVSRVEIDDEADRYRLYRFNVTFCNSSSVHECTPVYPKRLFMIVDVTGGEGLNSNTSEKEMPKWLWWVIGALIAFLFVLAWLVYKYWWKQKQTAADLQETDAELNMALEENELGFGHDLGVGDVAFNPMATGIPGSQRAPDLFGNEMNQMQANAANQRADVAVEKFSVRQQMGPQQGQRGGNDLSQRLLS